MIANELQISYKTRSNVKQIIDCPEKLHALILKHEDMAKNIDLHEMFFAVYFDSAQNVNGILKIANGGISSVNADIRIVLQGALLSNSVSLAVVHNHPSGFLQPSRNDIKLRDQIYKACEIMNIKLIDSLIISKEDYNSYIYQPI